MYLQSNRSIQHLNKTLTETEQNINMKIVKNLRIYILTLMCLPISPTTLPGQNLIYSITTENKKQDTDPAEIL